MCDFNNIFIFVFVFNSSDPFYSPAVKCAINHIQLRLEWVRWLGVRVRTVAVLRHILHSVRQYGKYCYCLFNLNDFDSILFTLPNVYWINKNPMKINRTQRAHTDKRFVQYMTAAAHTQQMAFGTSVLWIITISFKFMYIPIMPEVHAWNENESTLARLRNTCELAIILMHWITLTSFKHT